jgi:hypothetical protein
MAAAQEIGEWVIVGLIFFVIASIVIFTGYVFIKLLFADTVVDAVKYGALFIGLSVGGISIKSKAS